MLSSPHYSLQNGVFQHLFCIEIIATFKTYNSSLLTFMLQSLHVTRSALLKLDYLSFDAANLLTMKSLSANSLMTSPICELYSSYCESLTRACQEVLEANGIGPSKDESLPGDYPPKSHQISAVSCSSLIQCICSI